MPAVPDQVSELLAALRNGDRTAEMRLVPMIYSELRRIAGRLMREERAGHTLQPTALVHEAYLTLTSSDNRNWESRAHFFAAAAHLMRWILRDYARARATGKRGGGWQRVELRETAAVSGEQAEEYLAMDEAMTRLEQLDPRQFRIVELRYIVGLTTEEAARVLEISTATVQREWTLARAWLRHELRSGQP